MALLEIEKPVASSTASKKAVDHGVPAVVAGGSKQLGVLMVTGSYYPEVSGGGMQCRALSRALKQQVRIIILTTTTDSALSREEMVDGLPVHRVYILPGKWPSELSAAWRFISLFARLRGQIDIVHFHGFSRKTVLLLLLAKAYRKKTAIKLTSAGHDDPVSMRRQGRLRYYFYSRCDAFFAVSPRFEELYREADLPAQKFLLIPNGVNLERFHACDVKQQRDVRRQLGLPEGLKLILFVGFFSREKRPNVAFEAWLSLQEQGFPDTGLVFVGAKQGSYYEIDHQLAKAMQQRADELGIADKIRFVESAQDIERYYQAADFFILPSVREGFPNSLLEAMASGLPCITTRLSGVTDAAIKDGFTGRLVAADDVAAFSSALRKLLEDPPSAAAMGYRARQAIVERFALEKIAERYLSAYEQLAGRPEAACAGDLKGID